MTSCGIQGTSLIYLSHTRTYTSQGLCKEHIDSSRTCVLYPAQGNNKKGRRQTTKSRLGFYYVKKGQFKMISKSTNKRTKEISRRPGHGPGPISTPRRVTPRTLPAPHPGMTRDQAYGRGGTRN